MKFLSTLVCLLVFSLSTQAHVLSEIENKVRSLREQGVTPVIVSDLDETLISSSWRRYKSFLDAIPKVCGVPYQVSLCRHFYKIQYEDIWVYARSVKGNEYNAGPLYKKFGVVKPEIQKALLDEMLKVYLSGAHMEDDFAYSGASEYILGLKRLGATVFFVSSRYQSSQGMGTLRSLVSQHMILENEVRSIDRKVILRPDGMSSLEFKKMAFAKIQRLIGRTHGKAQVVGVLENEPENMNAMIEQWPDAVAGFLKGAALKPESLDPRAQVFSSYHVRD
jgi:hypothetical protein